MHTTTMLVAMPCLDHIKTPTVHSLFHATAQLNCPAKLHIHMSAYVHDARNKCVYKAIEEGFTHLMFIDSDMRFGGDSIQKLLDQDKDIIGGLYFRRQPPHLPTINEIEGDKIVIPKKFPRDKTFKTFSVATGFLLVKTEVFKKMKPEWFRFQEFKGKKMGEDVAFCHNAGRAGFDVWCDPTLDLGHVGEEVFTIQHYDMYQNLVESKTDAEFDGML